jgi:hypothetical protein
MPWWRSSSESHRISFSPMPLIFRYFWFIGAAFMLVNIIIWRRHLSGLIERGVISRDEVDHLTRWAIGWLVASPCVLGLIALAAHWSSPFCAGYLDFNTAPQAATSLVMIGGWIAILLWIWRGNGATLIARVGPALSARPAVAAYSPRIVRLAITAMVLVSAVGGAFSWRAMPDTPGLACPASAGAH